MDLLKIILGVVGTIIAAYATSSLLLAQMSNRKLFANRNTLIANRPYGSFAPH